MNTLVIEKTSNAQWHQLVYDAEKNAGTYLTEDLECYLVFLLNRFIREANMVKSVLALEFLESLHSQSSMQHQQLREVGDKCLLFAGLFPLQAERKHVNISYFIDLGKNVYARLSALPEKYWMGPYTDLHNKFVTLIDVLHTIREEAHKTPALSPMQAIECWQHCQNDRTLARLQHYTKALPVIGESKNETIH